MANKEKILVVEDDAPLREILVAELRQAGYLIVEAKDGQEGLDLALKERPDLILLDIIMPVMDGTAMLKLLREDSWGKHARVIVLTNLEGMQQVTKAIEYGALDYVIKTDWKLEDVIEKVKNSFIKAS